MARTVLRIGGADRVHFLQGLVTNDLKHLAHGLVYAAILTPQGKYLADFFLKDDGDAILLDADAGQAPGLAQRLAMYRLRAAVTIEDSGPPCPPRHGPRARRRAPRPAPPRPRLAALRAERGDDGTDFDAIRVAHCIPEAGIELIPNDSFILEAGFERLHGVDFRKGCYVGQEVTARMKHKTDLQEGPRHGGGRGIRPRRAPPSSRLTARRPAPSTPSRSGRGIAYLRFDRADAPMTAGPATVRLAPQAAAS